MNLSTSCVRPDGRFRIGIHRPGFTVRNLRPNDYPAVLGHLADGTAIDNHANFPSDDVTEPCADCIYEIANPFPFRGATYINSAWADVKAARPDTIRIPPPKACSLAERLADLKGKTGVTEIIDRLPHPLCIALAQASTDPEELLYLAGKACHILLDKEGRPVGIGYRKTPEGRVIPDITDPELFEVLVNNRFLPDDCKNALVLRPGVQGTNEITGEYPAGESDSHVFEYLRRNSYIPWGHFAANMANDAIRYRALDLSRGDMTGIRHLYYQRAYVRLADQLGLAPPPKRAAMDHDSLENLRKKILSRLKQSSAETLCFDCTLWGWNFGFGYAQSGHRLHASHQMIHQQNAMIPKTVTTDTDEIMPSFACGDLVRDFIRDYRKTSGRSFFQAYCRAIANNTRTDGKTTGPASLILSEDSHTLLFVPKAQVSEWEIQLMPKYPCGNILEADTEMRSSLDLGILRAVQILESMGAQMVTGIEFSKRFDAPDTDHHLLYSFIPRLPYAPGTFSEAQSRWISGCYPEDFAQACRMALATLTGGQGHGSS